LWFVLICIALASGCGGKPATTGGGTVATATGFAAVPITNSARSTPPAVIAEDGPVYHLPYAQPKLPTVRLRLGAHEIEAEVCRTLPEIATGLMFRKGIGADEGMLFLFAQPHQPAFYMKNVGFDIDVAYLDAEGVITEVVRLKAMDRTPVPAKADNVQFVLEVAPDFFTQRKLGPGTLVMTPQGSLKDTFFRR